MKLDKLNVHLKNVIFFKAVLYLIIVIVLLSMMPFIRQDLREVAQKKEQSQHHLEKVRLKLDAAKNYAFDSVRAIQDFEEFLKTSTLDNCFDRMKFIKNLRAIEIENNGPEIDDLKIKISSYHDGSRNQNIDGDLTLDDFIVDISFRAKSVGDFFEFGDRLKSIMPKGSFVTNMEISDITSLSPEIVDKLNLHERPLLFDVKLKMLLKEISYEKGAKSSLRSRS